MWPYKFQKQIIINLENIYDRKQILKKKNVFDAND